MSRGRKWFLEPTHANKGCHGNEFSLPPPPSARLVRHTDTPQAVTLRSESKTRVPLTLAVVAARHPLLDGHTHQVLLCVPVKEWMRSGKHSERERYPEFIPDFTVAPV